jgi:hypothetical protein
MRRRVGVSDPLAADLQFISKYALNVLADFKPEEAPMRPEAAAVFRKRTESLGKDSPMSHCLPGGLPFSSLIAPFKIVQTRRLIVMMLEDNNPTRQIHLDGRKHPDDPTPAWMGYSTGSGSAIRWSSTPSDSTTSAGSMPLGTLTVRVCESWSGSDGVISATSTRPSRSTTPRCTRSRLRSA